MHKVLITGVRGFIGRALSTRMLSEGWQVRGTVRDLKHLTRLPAEVDVALVGSIGPDTDWSKALNGVDVVVHLAARVHVLNDAASDPLAAFRWVNGERTGDRDQRSEVSGQKSGIRGHPG